MLLERSLCGFWNSQDWWKSCSLVYLLPITHFDYFGRDCLAAISVSYAALYAGCYIWWYWCVRFPMAPVPERTDAAYTLYGFGNTWTGGVPASWGIWIR
ncbi:hypothetical protein V5799_029291 [Amblyomma americanum]|uniref:Uncharacterized protein n=1 Tax=Amblyomma americanum TaxID=6943 RepID=A0AAQ4ERF8_AMBAM